MEKDTLYFDGDCPLCRTEVCKLEKYSHGDLELRNIHRLDQSEDAPAPQQLLARLHLKTADGVWLTGLDANIRAWQHTRFGALWSMLNWPVVRPLALLGYEIWLRYYRWSRR